MKIRFNFSIRFRLMIFTVLLILFIGGSMTYYAVWQMKAQTYETAVSKLSSDQKMVEKIIDSLYPGEWQIINGDLYKGAIRINQNYDIVDQLASLTGDNITIFHGNIRINTTVKKEGQRAIGTTCVPEVEKTVLQKGQSYHGVADVAGQKNLTVYVPIKSNAGQIIGMLFVGLPAAPLDKIIVQFTMKMLIFALIGIAVAVGLAYILTLTVALPLKRLEKDMELVAGGNFNRRSNIKHRDESGHLARSYNNMLEKVVQLIKGVQDDSLMVDKAAGQISTNVEANASLMSSLADKSTYLNQLAEQQTEVAEQTRMAMHEIRDTIQQVAVNTTSVAATAVAAANQAESGRDRVGQVLKQMQVISSNTVQSTTIMNALEQKSREIGDIIDIITSIATQTNLLALNAAIEAARAGENGRGFAVVAEEVRKLAEDSAKAAGQIAQLIKEVQAETGSMALLVKSEGQEVKRGEELVEETREGFNQILGAVEDVSRRVQEVSSATEEINNGIILAISVVDTTTSSARQTSETAVELSAMAQQQMATTQELNASIHELVQMASNMQEQASCFKI